MPREGLIAIEKTVERGGSSHTQKFWVRPEDAKRMVARGQAREVKTLAKLRQAKSPARVAPESRSAAISLLRDAGGLTSALEVASTYTEPTMTDPESRAQVPTEEVRAALEALRPPPLPTGEEYVTVHHATDEDTATAMLRDGVIPELKPGTLAAERYERGEISAFSPGGGLSRGVYVAEPGRAESYGRVVLELSIPKSFVEVSPEQSSLGVADPMQSLATHDGAVITKPIPPSAIRRIP